MRKMKDSSILGVGLVPDYWSQSRLNYECYIRARLGWRGLKAEEYVDEGFAFISAFNIQDGKLVWAPLNYITRERYDESPEIKLHIGDVLLVKDGAGVGKSARVDKLPFGGTAPNSSIGVITPYSNLSYRYVCYYLQSPVFGNFVGQLYNGMGVPHLTQEVLKTIKIPMPPTEEQEKIADFLDFKCAEIDNLSADIQSEIDTMEAYKRSVITEAVTKGLDKNVPMKDSGIEWVGEIPQSADLIRLSYISSLRNGYVGPTKDIFVDDGVRYIQSLHIKGGRIKYDNNYFVNELWGQNHPKIHTGNLLFTQTGDIGQVALVEDNFDGCNCHALIICDVKQEKCNSKYLLYYFLGNAGLEELLRYETGTTLKHLNSTKIKNSLVVLHSMTEQMRIVAYLDNKCDEIETIISQKQKQMDILADYKKSVIYEYVTGKKEVPVT